MPHSAKPAMPDRDFDRLRTKLLKSGVVPRHVARLVSELSEHFDDLECEGIQQGLAPQAASAHAEASIGSTSDIVEQVLRQPELRGWPYRYPRLARILLPIIYVTLLPAAPIFAGVAYAPAIGRWLACFVLSGLVTATMMLVMQISILAS